jgi:putative transposase
MRNANSHSERRRPAHHAFLENYGRTPFLFLTVCSHKRKHVLATPKAHAALVHAWQSAGQWIAGSYVIMPDHLHMFCSPAHREAENVACWVAYWKRLVSVEVPEHKPLWQRDCWDTQLRSHESYSEKWAYVRNNPVRASLVDHADEWPYQGSLNLLHW